MIAKPHPDINLHENLENGTIIPVTKVEINQFRERIHEFPLAAAADPIPCPVKAFMGFASVYDRDRSPSHPDLWMPSVLLYPNSH